MYTISFVENNSYRETKHIHIGIVASIKMFLILDNSIDQNMIDIVIVNKAKQHF